MQVDVTGYLACRIAGRGILDEKILGEALSRVEGLYKGIPHISHNNLQTLKRYARSNER